jgi:hypothetical protein
MLTLEAAIRAERPKATDVAVILSEQLDELRTDMRRESMQQLIMDIWQRSISE